MANVLLMTTGTEGGDLYPFLRIGEALLAHGHDVALLTHYGYQDTVRQVGLKFVALDNPEESEWFIEHIDLLSKPGNVHVLFQQHHLPRTLLTGYERVRELYRSRDTVLVVHQDLRVVASIAAEKLRLPVVPVFLSPTRMMNMPVLEAFCSVFSDDLNQIRTKIGLQSVGDWKAWLSVPRRHIALWPDWFAASELACLTHVEPVGFIRYDQIQPGGVPDEIQEILNHGKKPILITGGTSAQQGEKFFTAGVEACRLLAHQGILVTRHEHLVTSNLPDEVKWFKRVPSLASLIPYMVLVIHHGGMGTVGHVLAAGIPHLVLATGSDRPDNASRLQHLGVAFFLPPPQWQPNLVADAASRLLGSSQVLKRCQELAHRFVNVDPLAAACQVIENPIPNTDCLKGSVPAPQADQSSVPVPSKEQDFRTTKISGRVETLSPEKRALLVRRLNKRINSTG